MVPKISLINLQNQLEAERSERILERRAYQKRIDDLEMDLRQAREQLQKSSRPITREETKTQTFLNKDVMSKLQNQIRSQLQSGVKQHYISSNIRKTTVVNSNLLKPTISSQIKKDQMLRGKSNLKTNMAKKKIEFRTTRLDPLKQKSPTYQNGMNCDR